MKSRLEKINRRFPTKKKEDKPEKTTAMMEEEKQKLQKPLHTLQVETKRMIINRAHILFQSAMLISLLYYRVSRLLSPSPTATTASLLLLLAELILSFIWLQSSAFRWRPVSRKAFPDRLPASPLPAVDVFVCTADAVKEPPAGVMNTVLSAMAMDYPAEKLWVYLSDDAGADATLFALREAFSFAKAWVPFCRRHRVRRTCPEDYFAAENEEESAKDMNIHGRDFPMEREKMKVLYEEFEENIQRSSTNGLLEDDEQYRRSKSNHPPLIEVISDQDMDKLKEDEKIPHLVYVRREKAPAYHHHFKAGALNVLIRVSALLSNAPYILMLDCDMHCNDPNSAKAAMCFHLDPAISPTLAFVQYPQTFKNISTNDIYNCQLREAFKIYWYGCDGLNGPLLSGTCFYIKRKALYGTSPGMDFPKDFVECRKWFGRSSKLVMSLRLDYRCSYEDGYPSKELLGEALFVASCKYEKNTKWGKLVGFYYISLVEDFMTGFQLHIRGWKSVYYTPLTPQFLGNMPINLNDNLVQYKRWSAGLLEVAFSRYCPLIYGTMSGHPILHTLCFSYCAFMPFQCIFALCYATLPQLCLLNGISLYPKISDPWFVVFIGVFVSASCHHLFEVFVSGGTLKMWWNEQRISWMRNVSSTLFGFLDIASTFIGLKPVDFGLTSKVTEENQVDLYFKDVFDFQGAGFIFVPIVTCSILNIAALIGGLWRLIFVGGCSELIIQLLLSMYIVLISYPIIEGFAIRKDAACLPPFITLFSFILSMVILSVGFLVFKPR